MKPMLKNLVVYASETGNTKKLAEEIFSALPSSMGEKDIVDVRTWNGKLDAENYFIGFWANRGSCSLEIIDILSSLQNRNIALFGTCGMGSSAKYYASLEQNVCVWISASNNYLGSYFCKGKMQDLIRQKYESHRRPDNSSQIDMFLSHFEDALTHPDRTDLLKAHMFVEQCLDKIQSLTPA